MAGKPQVTLTFAGESSSLDRTFNSVGAGARQVDSDARAAGAGFDRVGEAADNVDTKAMGFRDTLTGVQDGFSGLKRVTSGDIGFESLLLLGMGVGDLASGMFNFLVPSLKSAAAWLGKTKVGMLATAAATKVWTAAQWLFNAAMLANPVTWIIIGIVALIAVIVLIATKTTWFQRIWNTAWGWIKRTAIDVWNWLKALPGRVGSAFGRIHGLISAPFRSAFNAIANAWNNTVGRLSWSIPGWVPGIGGNSISVPNLPTFHMGTASAGGGMPSEFLAVLRSGETVSTRGGGTAGAMTVRATGAGRPVEAALSEAIVGLIRRGSLQLVVSGNQVTAATRG